MEIRNNDLNKTLTIPFVLSFTDDKEDLINKWVNDEGASNINPVVDFEIDLYQYEGENLTYQFNFFCCGDNSADESTNPFYPYSKQTVFTPIRLTGESGTGYFINSYSNTLRDVFNLRPVEKQVIGYNVAGSNEWWISETNNTNIREMNVGKISKDVITNAQYIFTYFNSDNLTNRKQIDRVLVSANSTETGYDEFYFNKLIFTATTGQEEFSLNEFNAINYSSVLRISPNFANFYNPPIGVTYDAAKKPTLSLDKYNKTLGNNIYLSKNNDISELYLQIQFYNPKTGKSIEMITKSGSTINDILNTNRDGTIFYRSQYTDKYNYLKLNINSTTKTYNIRLYNPNTNSYDINPIISGTTVIPLYQKIITDVRVTNQSSPALPTPNNL